jgi:excisionase family DNA binding protein
MSEGKIQLMRMPIGVREVMDLHEAAAYLGVSEDSLYVYVQKGIVPAFRLGNRWKFKRSKVDEWMEKQSDMRRDWDGKEET